MRAWLAVLALAGGGCNQLLGITDVTYRDGGVPVDANPLIPDADPFVPDADPLAPDADPSVPDAEPSPDATPSCTNYYDTVEECDFTVEQCGVAYDTGTCQTPPGSCAVSGDAFMVTAKTNFYSNQPIYSITMYFVAEAGAAGDIDFHDINGDNTGDVLSAQPDCDSTGGSFQTLYFNPPAVRFHVYSVTGTVWIDEMTINPG